MNGFQKLSFGSTDFAGVNKKNSTKRMTAKKKIPKKPIAIAASVLAVVILFIVFAVVLPVKSAYNQAKITLAQAKAVKTDINWQNIELASVDLKKTQDHLNLTKQSVDALWYLRFIPLASLYYNDIYHLLNAGSYGLSGAQIAVDAIKPYADLLGLKGKGSFTAGSSQDRISTAVLTLGKITPRLDEIETQLVQAKTEIDQVNPDHYPGLFGGSKIRDQLTQLKTLTDNGVQFVQQAKPLVRDLPSVLGEPNDQKYLLLFQNDKERRPTGGFLTAYAIFRVSKGVIHVESSNDIYTLDATISNKPTAPGPILKYLPNVSQLNLRDSNLSPDFVKSMDTFKELYQKAGAYQKVDGIIAIDTHALVAAMDVLGDIQAGGETFTTKQDSRCACPEVIYSLESTADRPVNYVRTDRKSIIGDLMYAIMDKAFASSPRKYWGALFQTMITETSQKHVLFDIYNSDAQAGIESLNAAGRIAQNVKGDYFYLNETNFGGQKSNMYTSENMDQRYDVSSEGIIKKTVTIHYKNPFQPSDCNLERGGLCLNAPLRNWVRFYVPQGSKLVDSRGSEVKMSTYDELGKTVFEGFLIIRPLGTGTITITYELPFKLANGSPLPFLIQKQPGVDHIDTIITSGDRQINSFSLVSDKTFNLNVQ